jgi:hypothetical protein
MPTTGSRLTVVGKPYQACASLAVDDGALIEYHLRAEIATVSCHKAC